MKTQEEIIKRIKELKDSDMMGTERTDLTNYLEYSHAKEFLQGGVTEEIWKEMKKSTDEDVLKEMKEYIEFAWDKALGERGLSAGRSLSHYSAWIWLLDDGNFEEFTECATNNYAMYGKPVLYWICKKYNLKVDDEYLKEVDEDGS